MPDSAAESQKHHLSKIRPHGLVCAVNSLTFAVGEGEADILDPRPPGNACQRCNLHEGYADSVPRTGIRQCTRVLDIIREIGRKHFALVPGSRCGVQERSGRMILRLRTDRRTGLVPR